MNKDSTFNETANSVFTPETELTPQIVADAMENLPHDFIQRAKDELLVLKQAGKVKRIYTDSYISKTKNGTIENIEILRVLVSVGIKNKAQKALFPVSKKTSKTI